MSCRLIRASDGSNALLLRLNRPNQLNAIDWPTVLELDEALKAADEDASIRCVLLIGEGTRVQRGRGTSRVT